MLKFNTRQRVLMFCNTFDHSIDEVKNVLGFGVHARRMVSVINAAQEYTQAVLIHGVTAWERLVCSNIAECERHGCDQVQYGECSSSVLSPCCVRRICHSRLMSPTHHFALQAKHHGFTEEELNFIINYDINMGDKPNDSE